MKLIDSIPLSTFILVALTLGLAPFVPEPHIWEKLKMLASGSLSRPIDIFDLFFHGLPWGLLIVKLIRGDRRGGRADES
ncbi:RND transporter [Celeribacter sp. ULVN23_4]